MEFSQPEMALFVPFVLFCLPNKGKATALSQPVWQQKKALCPMLPPAKLTRPSLGKEANPFLLARAAHVALVWPV